MSTTDDLIPILKKLRLSGVLDTLDLREQEAADDALSSREFLFRLLNDEVERRDAKQLALRLRRARFDSDKSVAEFDFSFNTAIPKAKVTDLAAGGFIDKREVVCLIGPSGVGKSHLAQAIGQRACMLGNDVLYLTANQMFRQLRAARADHSLERTFKRFEKPSLLIIDDLGLRPLKDEQPEDLYEVINRRYERGAMIVTSNRAVEEWYPLFGDDLLASAAMDRLMHHAQVIEMNGQSYRNPKRRGGKAA